MSQKNARKYIIIQFLNRNIMNFLSNSPLLFPVFSTLRDTEESVVNENETRTIVLRTEDKMKEFDFDNRNVYSDNTLYARFYILVLWYTLKLIDKNWHKFTNLSHYFKMTRLRQLTKSISIGVFAIFFFETFCLTWGGVAHMLEVGLRPSRSTSEIF